MRKRIIFILAAWVLVAACSRQEIDQPDPSVYPVTTITARIDNGDTKTAYTIDEGLKKAIFSWAADDQIDGLIRMGTGSTAYYTGVRFVAQGAGTESEFLDGQLSGDRTVAELLAEDANAVFSDWAFYPSKKNAAFVNGDYRIDWSVSASNSKLTLDLPANLTPPMGNPLTVVPMMGHKNASDVYAFTPLTAVLAVPVDNLPDNANFIRVTSADAALAGSFTFDLGGTPSQDNVTYKNDAGMTIHFSGLSGATGTKTFYFPLPAGEIPAGLTLTVGSDTDTDACMTITTKKALTLVAGKITRTPAITFTPDDQQWADYITGTFKDEFVWSKRGWSGTIDVTVQRSGLHPEKYRIANPYTTASTANNYTPTTANIATDEYFVFYVDGESVWFENFNPGVEDGSGNPLTVTYRSSQAQYTRIVRAMTDGTPIELQFASYYLIPGNKYTRDDSESNDKIRLVLNHPATWTKVLDGTFIDEKMWNLHGWGTTRVPIELEQSSVSATDFRVANPYLIAKDEFNYSTYTSGITGDDYLYFSIQSGDAVRFVTFLAGIEDKASGGRPMKVWYPSDAGSFATALAGNLVASYRSDGLPAEVELYPIYTDPNDTGYKYTNQGDYRVRLSFPEAVVPETWTSLGTGRYMDEWFWSNNTFAPYNVEVEIWRSDLNANRYRVANPYTVANTAFKHTAIDGADDYLFLSVDASTGLVFYETLKTGMDRSGSAGRNLAAAHPTTWNELKGTTLSASTTKVASGTNAEPLEIQMGGVYYDSADNTHFYTNDTGLKHLWFPGYDAGETWSLYAEGTYQDVTYDAKINGSDAIGAVAVAIQQSSINSNRFRVANPYRDNVDPSLLRSTYDEYLYFQIGNGRLYFEPFRPGVRMDSDPKELAIWHPVNSNFMGWNQGGSDFTGSSVLSTNSDGSPKKVQLGAHYFDIATPNPGYCYTRHGSSWPNDRIYITFGSTDKLEVEHSQSAISASSHNPVATLTLPAGTMERLVVKVTGLIPSMENVGLRLWDKAANGWMNGSYVAPDSNGIVTIDSFSSAAFTGGIDLNFWFTGNPIGAGVHFEIQEAVVSGASLPIVQEDVVHLGRLTLNNGGDNVTVRNNTAETVTSFRIPALVTTNSGALIAAYDVRYKSSADLQGDIDVGMKRSTDGGKTWSELQLIMDMGQYDGLSEEQNGIGDPCLLVDENTGRIFCFAVWAHGHPRSDYGTALAWAGTGFSYLDTPQFMMVYSDDDGLTWSAPINITEQIKLPDWKMTFQGPGRGITMKDGTLVVPIQHQEGTATRHGYTALYAGIMYSTDHGYTWHTHNYAYPVTSESAVAEIEPGMLLLTMRDEMDTRVRRNYVTSDLGRTWQKHVSDGQLIEPTCEASLLHVDAADNVLGKDLLLFSNPHNNTTSRVMMTIQISEDKGATWPHSLLLESGGAQYSCLTMIDDATVGIIYERSTTGPIVFQAIPLVDIVH